MTYELTPEMMLAFQMESKFKNMIKDEAPQPVNKWAQLGNIEETITSSVSSLFSGVSFNLENIFQGVHELTSWLINHVICYAFFAIFFMFAMEIVALALKHFKVDKKLPKCLATIIDKMATIPEFFWSKFMIFRAESILPAFKNFAMDLKPIVAGIKERITHALVKLAHQVGPFMNNLYAEVSTTVMTYLEDIIPMLQNAGFMPMIEELPTQIMA